MPKFILFGPGKIVLTQNFLKVVKNVKKMSRLERIKVTKEDIFFSINQKDANHTLKFMPSCPFSCQIGLKMQFMGDIVQFMQCT